MNIRTVKIILVQKVDRDNGNLLGYRIAKLINAIKVEPYSFSDKPVRVGDVIDEKYAEGLARVRHYEVTVTQERE